MDYRARPTTWWLALVDWIDAADPGLVRRRAAAWAALAALTAWVAVLGLTALPGGGMGRREALFAVTVCFVSAVVVVDARRTERRTTLLWSLPAWAGALLLGALLQPIPRALPVALLVLIFVSYATRRLGLRPGELALLVTMGVYFGGNADITWNRLPWFLVSVGIGVGSLWLWQFVLLPYDPVQSLRDSVRSFYDRAAGLVGAVGANFDASTAALVAVEQAGDQQRRLRQIKLSRSVIESQFPGVLAPRGWQRDQINRLQLALYTAERGLALMVQGAGTRAQVAAIPTTLHEPLANGIDALHQGLSAGGQESLLVLAEQSELLRQRVEALGTARWQVNPDGSPAPTAWATDGLRLVNGMRQVAASVTQVRTLVSQAGMPNAVADPMAVSSAPSPRPTPPPVRVWGRFTVHPTTALGIQAALATGLAMLAAMLLGIDHANWVFWTAFSVIAGSSGESVRKLALRVVGTVAGVVVGVAVALLGPESAWFVGPGAVICMFLTVYYRPVSYPKMVFWLNLGLAMVYTHQGARVMDLLIMRPYATFVGALVAAAVVLFVFPVSIAGRFKTAGEQYLRTVDALVAEFVAFATGRGVADHLMPAQVKVEAAYEQLEQTLPSIAFENFPFAQADNPLTEQAQQLAALQAEVARLAPAAQDPSFVAVQGVGARALALLCERIHQAIQAAIPLLGGELHRLRSTKSPAQLAGAQADDDPILTTIPGLTIQQEAASSALWQGSGPILLSIYNAASQLAGPLSASSKPNKPLTLH